MTLTNTSSTPIQFHPNYGIFVASRAQSLADSNNKDFGHDHRGLTLQPGKSVTLKASRTLDGAESWWFWPGFNINGQWGPFRWMEKTLYVFGPQAEARQASRELTVADILANPAGYDQKIVTVKGLALIVRKQVSSSGSPWNLISFADLTDNKKILNVFGPGHAPIGNGDVIRVTGTFRAKSQRGRYTFDNEIETSAERITLVQKSKD